MDFLKASFLLLLIQLLNVQFKVSLGSPLPSSSPGHDEVGNDFDIQQLVAQGNILPTLASAKLSRPPKCLGSKTSSTSPPVESFYTPTATPVVTSIPIGTVIPTVTAITKSTAPVSVSATATATATATHGTSGDYAPPASVIGSNSVMTASNGGAIKKAMVAGVQSVIPSNDNARAFALAAAVAETSAGTYRPSKSNQQAVGKYNTDSEEIGITRMSRKLLKTLGFSESDITSMNSGSVAGDQLSGVAIAKGLTKYGLYGFLHYQRGGVTRYNKFVSNALSSSEKSDQAIFNRQYFETQKGMLQLGLVNDGSNKYVYSTTSAQAI